MKASYKAVSITSEKFVCQFPSVNLLVVTMLLFEDLVLLFILSWTATKVVGRQINLSFWSTFFFQYKYLIVS